MVKFLLWCILFVLCWPLALVALILYPFVWLLLLPFKLVGIAVGGVLALVWAIVAWRATRPAGSWDRRLRAAVPLIGIPAVIAMAVYLPWFLRDWAVFGNPLPGQAAAEVASVAV